MGRRERLLIAWAVLIFAGCGSGGGGAITAGDVDIGGGRTMYRECRGIGTPTVVLVSGKGNRADIWIQPSDKSNSRILSVTMRIGGRSRYLIRPGSKTSRYGPVERTRKI